MKEKDLLDELIIETHDLFDEIMTSEAVALQQDEVIALIKETYPDAHPESISRYIEIIDYIKNDINPNAYF